MLNRNATELAIASGTDPATFRRYEVQEGVPAGNTSTLVSIKPALDLADIEFIGDPLVSPGVTWRINCDDQLLVIFAFVLKTLPWFVRGCRNKTRY